MTNKNSRDKGKRVYMAPGALRREGSRGVSSFFSVRESTQPTIELQDTVDSSETRNPLLDDIPFPEEDRLRVDEIERNVDLRETPRSGSEENLRQSATGTTTNRKRKVRGRNLCKPVANLRDGCKIQVKFYNNRVIDNSVFSRHLGKIVRDRNICPLKVHSWKDIPEDRKDHMWEAVTDKFDNENMQSCREAVLEHMHSLWNNWRGDMYRNNVNKRTLQEALRNVPKGVDQEDWHWLVREHYASKEYQEASIRNSNNRAKLKMQSRTGSKPIRQVMWDMGGKDGNPPSLAALFFETRKKGENIEDIESREKYDEIVQVTQSEPGISNIELVERCFGAQRHDHVVGFGGGLKPKDVRGSQRSRVQLEARLRESEQENHTLKRRVEDLESKVEFLYNMAQREQSNATSSSLNTNNTDGQ